MPNSSSPVLQAQKKCPALSAGQRTVTAQVTMAFSDGGVQPNNTIAPYVAEGLVQDSVAGARQMVGAVTTVARTCGPFSLVAYGVPVSITLTTVPFPTIGDQTAALKVTLSHGRFRVDLGDAVTIRHGGTVIVVADVGYPLNSELIQQVAERAYQKVAARW